MVVSVHDLFAILVRVLEAFEDDYVVGEFYHPVDVGSQVKFKKVLGSF